MSAAPPQPSRVMRAKPDLVVFWVGIAALAILAALAPIASAVSMMVIESCSGRCVVGAMHLGQIITAAGPALVLIGTAVAGVLLRRRRGARIFWIPLLGIALAIGLIILGDAIIRAGAGGR